MNVMSNINPYAYSICGPCEQCEQAWNGNDLEYYMETYIRNHGTII